MAGGCEVEAMAGVPQGGGDGRRLRGEAMAQAVARWRRWQAARWMMAGGCEV
jgi:hypothetical protein